MVSHRVAGAPLDFAALRSELEVPGDFPSAAAAEARAAAEAGPGSGAPPAGRGAGGNPLDRTDLALVTVDPAGSRDLDQAVHLARDGSGYLVSYAIADVAAFVAPGGALDAETHRRGETLYFPDTRVPLHPAVLSEHAASLLPGVVRAAVLWQIALDRDGEVRAVDVRRAHVRSRAQLDYAGLQRAIDAGTAPEPVALLAEVGRLRQALARARHAIDLDLPEQAVEPDGDHGWSLVLRETLPVEQWNAEISLLTGMCAARVMLDGGVGLLRTVPEPDDGAVRALRRAAAALDVAWPDSALPGDVLAGVDRGNPRHVAFIDHAVALLRGAGYVAFRARPDTEPVHAGIGAPYAHVTAPLRRLVDRYGSETCLALHAGRDVPAWVTGSLDALPEAMQRADHRAHVVDRAVVDATEAWLLRGRVGDDFPAVVIDADEHAGTVVVEEPAVRARCDGEALPVGGRITARLVEADVAARSVRFTRVD